MTKQEFKFWFYPDADLASQIAKDAESDKKKRELHINYAIKSLNLATGFNFVFDDSVCFNGAFVFYDEVKQKKCKWLRKGVSSAQVLGASHPLSDMVKSMLSALPSRPDYTGFSKIIAKYPKCYQSVMIDGLTVGTKASAFNNGLWIAEPIRVGQSCDLSDVYGFVEVSDRDYNAAQKSPAQGRALIRLADVSLLQ